LILNIVPSVETVVNSDRIVLVWALFGKIKELFKVIDEGLEQEITVDLPFDISG